jgi:ribosomal protein S18 acetylase RimI-like enzyme
VAVSGGGSIRRYGGLVVALSGVADQTQQVAVVEGALEDPQASVVAAETAFRLAGWAPAVDLVAGVHPEVEDVLSTRGYGIVVERPGMVLDLSMRPTRAVARAGIDVRTARPHDLTAVVGLQSRAFGMDAGIAGAMLPARALGDPGLVLIVAAERGSGRLVGAVSVHLDGDVAGVIGAAVEPAVQGSGIGTALAEAALRSCASSGASTVWLQSTPEGERLWRRIGFVEVGRCQVWLASHHPDPELHESWIPTGL